jgi:hypothetical protein
MSKKSKNEVFLQKGILTAGTGDLYGLHVSKKGVLFFRDYSKTKKTQKT